MELKRLTVEVNGIDDVLTQLKTWQDDPSSDISKEGDAVHIDRLRLLQSVQVNMPNIQEKIQKFVEKLAWKDPITQEPRYGPVMQEKIQTLHERIIHIQESILTESKRIEIKASHALEIQKERMNRDEEEMKRKEEHEKKVKEEIEYKQYLADQAAEKSRQEEEQAAREIQQSIAMAAQRRRDERARAQLEEERRLEQERLAMEMINQRIIVGKEGLTIAMEMLSKHFQTDIKGFRKAIQTLFALLKNVCGNPENAMFRHIKASNEHFHRDLGQYPGGIQCLLALGFIERKQQDGEIVYILEEPDLSADLDAWSNWFDQLKELKDFVDNKLQ